MQPINRQGRRLAKRAKNVSLTILTVGCLATFVVPSAAHVIAPATLAIWAFCLRVLIGDQIWLGIGVALVAACALTVIVTLPGPFAEPALLMLAVGYLLDVMAQCWRIRVLSASTTPATDGVRG